MDIWHTDGPPIVSRPQPRPKAPESLTKDDVRSMRRRVEATPNTTAREIVPDLESLGEAVKKKVEEGRALIAADDDHTAPMF